MRLQSKANFDKEGSDASDYFIFLFDEEEVNKQLQFNPRNKKTNVMYNRVETQRVFCFWCFNAGIGFREIQELGPRSIILTSGTLSPMQSFQSELQVHFEEKIENPHVISNEQVSINIVRKGQWGNPFNFSYSKRDNDATFIDLGKSILKIGQITPGGILIFFPSYWMMDKCFVMWEKNGIIKEIEKCKRVFKEPKETSLYQPTMDEYY